MSDQSPTAGSIDNTVKGNLNSGVKAFESGNFSDAVVFFERAALHAPDDAMIGHNLGYALYRAKRPQEATAILEKAANTSKNASTWTLLGEVYESLGHQAKAFQCYKLALRAKPNDYTTLIKLGALKEAMGDKAGGRSCYQLALAAHPRDLHATIKYTNLIFEKEPELAVRLWEDLLANVGGNLDLRAAALEQLICKKEWWERIKRGEMPYHASRRDELFFNYALDNLKDLDNTHQARLNKKPDNQGIMVAAGLTKFCLGERHEAERLFRAAAEKIKGNIYDAVRFEPAFYDELRAFTDADLTCTLAPVIEVAPLVPNGRGILYLSCNFTYFRAFALPMIVSLREHSPETPVHIHLMDANEEETHFALRFMEHLAPVKFGVSVERPGLTAASAQEARSYYHAVRFIRFYEHLCHYGVPLWLMDVDAVINQNLDELFRMLDGSDVSMRIRPGRIEPWNQFNACVVGGSPDERSREYFRLIAAYLAYFFQRKSLRWGIDQLAMYGVFADMEDRGSAPSLALLGEREVDYSYRDDGFVWCNSGAGKFQHLQRLSNPGTLPLANFDDNRFVGVFERHWKECERITAALADPNIPPQT